MWWEGHTCRNTQPGRGNEMETDILMPAFSDNFSMFCRKKNFIKIFFFVCNYSCISAIFHCLYWSACMKIYELKKKSLKNFPFCFFVVPYRRCNAEKNPRKTRWSSAIQSALIQSDSFFFLTHILYRRLMHKIVHFSRERRERSIRIEEKALKPKAVR